MKAKLVAAFVGLGVLAFVAVFIWGAVRPLDPVQSRGGADAPTASTSEAFSDGRIDIRIYALGNRDIRIEIQFMPDASASGVAGGRPDINVAMVGMNMDGLSPPLEQVEAGVWSANVKLPMAGRWIANAGFGDELAEVEFDAQ